MAYPFNFVKISFGGNIYGDKDIWTCALNFGHEDSNEGFEDGNLGDSIDEIATAVGAFISKNTLGISNKADLRWVKMAFIGEDGLYFREPVIYDFPTPLAGNEAVNVPAQNALAITFESDKFRAPGKNARIFLPMYAKAPAADGYISEADAQYVIEATQELLTAIRASLTEEDITPPTLIVASQKTLVHNPVTKLKVGRVIDTQRRRRNKFQEAYVGPVPAYLPAP